MSLLEEITLREHQPKTMEVKATKRKKDSKTIRPPETLDEFKARKKKYRDSHKEQQDSYRQKNREKRLQAWQDHIKSRKAQGDSNDI